MRAAAVAALTVATLVTSARGASPDAGAPADPAAGWLAHLRRCQRGVFSIQARFEQQRVHKLRSGDPPLEGVVKVRRGGRVRLEYDAPGRRLLVSDGATLVAHDRGQKIAYRSSASASLLVRLFGFFVGEGAGKAFEARLIGGSKSPGEGRAAIELTPLRRDPVVASIVLTVEERCPGVSRVLVVDSTGAVLKVSLSRVRTNVGLGKALFEFRPPPGVRIVEP